MQGGPYNGMRPQQGMDLICGKRIVLLGANVYGFNDFVGKNLIRVMPATAGASFVSCFDFLNYFAVFEYTLIR